MPKSDFEMLFESEVKELGWGYHQGKVVQVTQDSVMVDIGYKSEGHVPLRVSSSTGRTPPVKVGDEIAVLLERREDDRSYIVLSKAKADQLKIWDVIIDPTRHAHRRNNPQGSRAVYVDIKGYGAFCRARRWI